MNISTIQTGQPTSREWEDLWLLCEMYWDSIQTRVLEKRAVALRKYQHHNNVAFAWYFLVVNPKAFCSLNEPGINMTILLQLT